ncbi:hypothetical protein [Pseudomonas indica]|uniref:hypothetical protein n=1 Tax=Pseudomonas indica TaxID=137658 RepID=UPI003FD5A8F6
MTRREFDSFHQAVCPCGKGEIIRRVESTDYRYTSVHISYSLECRDCASLWRLEHGSLILRSSELPYLSAKSVSDAARNELYKFAQVLVKRYFEAKIFKSKKAELEHLKEIGIYDASYNSYVKDRRTKEIHEVAYGLKNTQWLRSITSSQEEASTLSRLALASEISAQKSAAAYRLIERRSFIKRPSNTYMDSPHK